MARTIMITSGKGGTGKTMFALNFAVTLAKLGKRTAIIDMNTGLRALDLAAGIENRSIFDICDIINEVSSIDNVVIRPSYDDKLGIIPACQDIDSEDIILKGIHSLIDILIEKYHYEYVVIDCPPGIGRVTDACAEASDDAVIVLTPDISTLRDADAVEDRLLRRYAINRYYVLNNVMYELIDNEVELTPKQIDLRMKSQLLGIIQTDINIRVSMNVGVPVVLKRNTYIAKNFEKMAIRYISSQRENR